jgi:hypothetical protein
LLVYFFYGITHSQAGAAFSTGIDDDGRDDYHNDNDTDVDDFLFDDEQSFLLAN